MYMGEWGWQGYNLLQTACGQRRGGRDSDTEREQGRREWGGRVRTGKEEMSWQERSNTERIKKKQGERQRDVEVS